MTPPAVIATSVNSALIKTRPVQLGVYPTKEGTIAWAGQVRDEEAVAARPVVMAAAAHPAAIGWVEAGPAEASPVAVIIGIIMMSPRTAASLQAPSIRIHMGGHVRLDCRIS